MSPIITATTPKERFKTMTTAYTILTPRSGKPCFGDASLELLKVPTTDPHVFISVNLSYDKGSIYRKRCYGVIVVPITDNGHGTTIYDSKKSGSIFLEEVTRYSEKSLLKAADTATEHPNFMRLLSEVAESSHLTIVGEWNHNTAV